jgi:hypothetical protein
VVPIRISSPKTGPDMAARKRTSPLSESNLDHLVRTKQEVHRMMSKVIYLDKLMTNIFTLLKYFPSSS